MTRQWIDERELFQFDMFLAVDHPLFDVQSFENGGQLLNDAVFHFFRPEILRLREELLNQLRESHVMPLLEKGANFLVGDRVPRGDAVEAVARSAREISRGIRRGGRRRWEWHHFGLDRSHLFFTSFLMTFLWKKRTQLRERGKRMSPWPVLICSEGIGWVFVELWRIKERVENEPAEE